MLICSRVSDGCATVECIGKCVHRSTATMGMGMGMGIIHTDLCVYSKG